jgi:hypothetical protein
MVGRVRRDRWPATGGWFCRAAPWGLVVWKPGRRPDPGGFRVFAIPRRKAANGRNGGDEDLTPFRRADTRCRTVSMVYSTVLPHRFFPDDAANPHFLSMVHVTGDLEHVSQ